MLSLICLTGGELKSQVLQKINCFTCVSEVCKFYCIEYDFISCLTNQRKIFIFFFIIDTFKYVKYKYYWPVNYLNLIIVIVKNHP